MLAASLCNVTLSIVQSPEERVAKPIAWSNRKQKLDKSHICYKIKKFKKKI